MFANFQAVALLAASAAATTNTYTAVTTPLAYANATTAATTAQTYTIETDDKTYLNITGTHSMTRKYHFSEAYDVGVTWGCFNTDVPN